MFSIQDEVGCYIACVADSGLLPWLMASLFMALLLFAFYLKARSSRSRISSFIAAQLCMLASIAMVVSSMQCSRMLTIEIYTAYVFLSTMLILFLPRIYYRILIKRYRARPVAELMEWPQVFVNSLKEQYKTPGMSEVYYYNSAVPRAFASGKTIFLSMGLLEIMDKAELKAILAHEVWHLRHNTRTPILRHLSMITFTRNFSESELENMADIFAADVVSRRAVESARSKMS
ncbi:MAG: M48 family metalloprotease [Methanolobus sp.]|uniref:M48 family metalloprotease n=1 Tax=Methanolobus sp. TaxID=1874737 RepID=UPI00272FC1FE|nr:M48 family metalloprotease [Methanolobus sp.]MDP2218285.1 M48 family metalloprotease [Methanolobus sp.]